jgi:uncharacterized protein
MRRKLQRVLVPLVVGYVLLCSCVAGFQRSLTYFPEDRLAMTPYQVGLAGEDISLSTDDGLELAAWWFPHPEPRGAVILCHGNGGNRSYALPLARRFFDRGFSVLDFDYRGYGGNPGSPSEDGLRADAHAALAHVTAEGFTPERILVHGHSLGSAVAIALAAESDVGAVIIENAFSSLTDVASELYWWLPVRLLVRDTWDNTARLEHVDEPLFIAYARDDRMIGSSHSQELAERAGVVPFAFDGNHNDSCLFEDDDGELASFLDAHFPRESNE